MRGNKLVNQPIAIPLWRLSASLGLQLNRQGNNKSQAFVGGHGIPYHWGGRITVRLRAHIPKNGISVNRLACFGRDQTETPGAHSETPGATQGGTT